MRTILLIAILLPALAHASGWIELGITPAARVMLDKDSIERSGDTAKASLKFIYHQSQPGQTITLGKPFDSSINRYYLDCSTQKYQVLQLTVLNKQDTVGTFNASLNLNDLDEAKPGTGVMLLMDKLCPAGKPGSALQQH